VRPRTAGKLALAAATIGLAIATFASGGSSPAVLAAAIKFGVPAGQEGIPAATARPEHRIRYRVHDGDTLSAISARFYGSARWDLAIYVRNRALIGADPNLIVSGQQLRIPRRPWRVHVSRAVIALLAPQPAAGTAAPPATATTPEAPPPAPAPQGTVQEEAQQIFGSQYGCAAAIIVRESDWNVYATNPYSGAYGIPQALPGYKMASAGADWQTSAWTQLEWMLGYVDATYGGACNAWSFWQAHGSY
jgi:hypothetical protein